MEQNDLALRDFHQAFIIDPNKEISFESAIEICQERKDYDRMLEFCSEMLQIRPDFSDAYLFRGIAYNTTGQFQLAKEDLLKAEKHGNKKASSLLKTVEKLK